MPPQPAIDPRAEEPWPDAPLMVGGVSRLRVATVVGLVVGIVATERTESAGSKQVIADYAENGIPPFAGEHRMVEGDRQDLIRTEGRVVSSVAIHDIEEPSALVRPEPRLNDS